MRQPPLTFLFIVFSTTPALACPLCHTKTGRQVRAGIFGPDFGFNLLVTIIPFVIFLGITAFIYFGPPIRRSPANGSESNEFASGVCPNGEVL
jgi:hypothetical protein